MCRFIKDYTQYGLQIRTSLGQGSGQPAFPLESKNDSTFTFDMAGIRILFHSDSLTLYQGGMTIPMAREKGE
ncbi:MAG: hypothetical protein PHG67_13880 [Bacteroidales bacterium]|nr:hypothetical protein [Bacteroidales bacterium]